MTVEWATISGGERVTGHVIFMVTGQIFKTGIWSLAFKAEIWSVALIPLSSAGCESPWSLTNGKDLDWFHCAGLAVDGRSAGMATAAFFAVNFLRHRRPLTAAAPLLVYGNFTLIFGLAYLVQNSSFQLIQLWPVPILIVLSVFLFKQNQRESAKIFSKDW